MANRLVFLFLSLAVSNWSLAQTGRDSIAATDSVAGLSRHLGMDTARPQKDSASPGLHRVKPSQVKAKKDSLSLSNASLPVVVAQPKALNTQVEVEAISRSALLANPWFNFYSKPPRLEEEIHEVHSYDSIFYLIVGLLFYFALVKTLFGKYLGNLLTLFFRASMRQQQIREQVLQLPLPSLALNFLFVISGGLYLTFLIRYFGYAPKADFWVLFGYCCLVLALIYLVKFCLLKCSGWVFHIQRATDTYIFVVFLTNKILGIFLLPFLVTLSFSGPLLSEIAITASLMMAAIFYLRRFLVSFAPIRKEIKVNGLHFFLYLCAFEIAPLLLIYKVLLTYLKKAY